MAGTEIGVQVQLKGQFQPVDGRYHWYGRIAANERLSDIADGKKRTTEIRTPDGSAKGEISDPDPWGRYRIMGTSTPPFHVPNSLEEIVGAG